MTKLNSLGMKQDGSKVGGPRSAKEAHLGDRKVRSASWSRPSKIQRYENQKISYPPIVFKARFRNSDYQEKIPVQKRLKGPFKKFTPGMVYTLAGGLCLKHEDKNVEPYYALWKVLFNFRMVIIFR